jgi:mRNA-degrading endonuclease RelE of RelBE toxin-antitoxin system
MKVELSPQVIDFVRRLAPAPRQMLRQALRELARDRGDIKALEGPLDGYCRLKVHSYRIIFCYAKRGVIQCIFAERRSIIYEVFAQALGDRLSGGEDR